MMFDADRIFFTADTHFGHANIIKYCGRPFADVDAMNNALIENWNSVVCPGDTVYHLGDLTLGGMKWAHHYLSQLNGIVYIVPGNHDRRWVGEYRHKTEWASMRACARERGSPTILRSIETVKFGEIGVQLELCHYPVRVWNMRHYGTIHLHGHTHLKGFGVRFMYNVGVDVNSFKPVSLHEVLTSATIYEAIEEEPVT